MHNAIIKPVPGPVSPQLPSYADCAAKARINAGLDTDDQAQVEVSK